MALSQKIKFNTDAYLFHEAQKCLHTYHISNMRNSHHIGDESLQFENAILNKSEVFVVSEVLQGFVGQGRKHIAQVMAFHILLYLRVEFSELAESSGDF